MKKLLLSALAAFGICSIAAVGSVSAQEKETSTGIKEYNISINKASEGVIARGVSYEGISLEGKTYDAAVSEINKYVNERLERYIKFSVLGYEYEYNGQSFGTEWKNPEVIEQLKDVLLDGNFVEQYKKQKDLDENPLDIDLEFAINEEKVSEMVDLYVNTYTTSPKNATVKRENGQFVVSQSVDGIGFDEAEIKSDLIARLEDFSNADSVTYDFPFTQTPAEYDSSFFNFSSVPLGSYSTAKLGDAGRKNNIIVSATNMNGHMFYPGEEISTLGMYGPVTLEAGYQYAPGYENGSQVDTVGGGICQTTTTLYNAVLRAELKVTSRKGHSMMVNYVPPAMDATVAPPGLDFKFMNSTNYPIYIESYVDGDNIVVNIWGVEERPANRTISFSTDIEYLEWPAVLYNQIVDDTSCTVGKAYVGDKHHTYIDPHPSLKATSYKHVYIDGVETEVTPVSTDKYVAMTGTLYRASDCLVSASVSPSSSAYAVFPYIGWTINLEVTTLNGTPWPNN